MPLEIGYLLNGRYRVERILGQGGMGAVYLATDETLGAHCAVKENLNPSPDAERQFRREANLLASLRHHNLPRVTNHFILGNQQYLVMDFVEGEDLKERFARQGLLPEVDVLLWAAQICEALTYLHGLTPPVVHRDIKPANIKLTDEENVMLVDFGIAKASAAGSKTTTSAVALTPGFAPPEQYGMGRTDSRTDQYALAATLYTLLTGQTPPDSMERLLGNVKLIPPKELRPDLSEAVNDALVRALELKPDGRFPTVADFKTALFAQLTGQTKPVAALQPVVEAAQATRVAAQATIARSAETVPAPPTAKPKPSGLPGWVLPVGIGGAIVVVGVIALGFAGLSALRATETPVPTATHTLAPTVPAPTAIPVSANTATPTPEPLTATPLPPTDTPTPEPPTATPTVAGTPIGGGGRIAFISDRDGQHYQVYTMNADGSDVKQITFDERDKWSPNWKLGTLGTLTGAVLAWSPDGTRLLYVAENSPGSGLDVWIINADGTNPQNLTAPTRPIEAGDDFHPAWCSEDWIAFTSTRANNIPQIFMMRPDNRRPRNFSAIHSSPIEYSPVWFPDCKRFLLISTQNGAAELWRVFPFTQTYATLWDTFPPFDQQSYRVFLSDKAAYDADVADPAVSPDGQYVTYTRRSREGNDIIVTTVSDSQFTMQIQALTTTHNNSMPSWSPDGRYIVFVSKRDGNPEIYRMLSGGQDQINLTDNGAVDTDPVWQPKP
jgi:Tol biopolymer transport system component